jgi:hypothetical protein
MGLAGVLLGLGLLVWLAYRGWSVLLLAPLATLVAAAFAGEPLLASWTQTFMGSAAQFVAQFFPLFLLGALFGKLIDSGAVETIAAFVTKKLGARRAVLAVHPGHFHLHNVGPSWDASHPKHHPHALLRHHDLRRPGSRDRGLCRHDRHRALLAALGDGGRAPARRGLRH